ncbi:MAG: uracil-DNA glycosylase [Desulfuromonas sp.]|nr:MAG: uracil-DNA glycosylase [Desulfuromonas sp.]
MATIPLEGLIECRQCVRLADYIETLPPAKQRSRDDYWNRPVPGFGDLDARICLVGLAPGAHGANRTGRPFTGDGAGDFMYPLLHAAGFASQAEAEHTDDGLELNDLYITNAVKCVPPENKPKADEYRTCRPYLASELAELPRLKIVVALGRGAFDSCLAHFLAAGLIERRADYRFAHNARFEIAPGLWLVACYHTSRYNVQTGRMTTELFSSFLAGLRGMLDENG